MIDVRGDEHECGLSIGGRAVALAWAEGGRGGGHHIVRTSDSLPIAGVFARIAAVTGGKLDPEVRLTRQVDPVFAHFVDGAYHLSYHPVYPLTDYLEYDDDTAYGAAPEHFYAGHHTLLATRATASLDATRVRDLAARIAKGERPVAIAARATDAAFAWVLDGHHKLAAYRRLGAQPALLLIERSDAALDTEHALQLLGKAKPYAMEYLAARAAR